MNFSFKYIFIDKTTSKIWTAIQDEDLSNMMETIYDWELIADNFDEFIDKLYYIPDEDTKERISEEQVRNLIDVLSKKEK